MEEKAVTQRPDWLMGWKMGMCLKYCMAKPRRTFDRSYCKAPRRRRDVQPNPKDAAPGLMMDEVEALARRLGVDLLATAPAEDFRAAGLDLAAHLPDGRSALVLGIGYPERCHLATGFLAGQAELLLAKHIQERYGYSVLPRSGVSDDQAAIVCGVAREAPDEGLTDEGARHVMGSSLKIAGGRGKAVTERFGHRQIWRTILTSAPLARSQRTTTDIPRPGGDTPAALAAKVRQIAREAGADLVGIAPAGRLAEAAPQLRGIFGGLDDYFIVEDAGWPIAGENIWGGQAQPFNPKARNVRLKPKTPEDHLPGARSVIVFGLGLLGASVDRAGQPPASKAGHFQTGVHEEAHRQLELAMLPVARMLDAMGYRVAATRDLEGLASRVSGGDVDLTASRFAALAAGLGDLGWHGLVLTPQFGARQRFACLVTDAELACDDVYAGPALCRRCFACAEACPVRAISKNESHAVTIAGRAFVWGKPDRLRCDFAQRYGLVAAEGGATVGCQNDFPVPDPITPEAVCETMRAADRIQRPSYTPTVERCFAECPAHKTGVQVRPRCVAGDDSRAR
jgi:Fe-S-cluster-containing hydrogenase component 2